jgi:hypothetical protein
MGKQEDLYAAAKKLGFDDVIVIGVNDEGDITTIHTLDDLTTISLLEVSAGQLRREFMEELLERLKIRSN